MTATEERVSDRVRRAETVADHAHRLLFEGTGVSLLIVNWPSGAIERHQDVDGERLAPGVVDGLAARLRKMLCRAARAGLATGRFFVNIEDDTVKAHLTAGERESWVMPNLGAEAE